MDWEEKNRNWIRIGINSWEVDGYKSFWKDEKKEMVEGKFWRWNVRIGYG